MGKIGRIISIISQGLCSGCGFCVAICPINALALVERQGFYRPQFIALNCTECGLCLKVCPTISIHNQATISKHHKYNPFIGYYIDCFLCYATDYSIRVNASSGGCITALLEYMLKEHLVDEVIVTIPNKKDPMYGSAISTSDINTVIKAVGSKYTQVNFVDAVRSIIRSKRKKFAFVGLPCHIRALRNLEETLRLNNIILRIGLYCNNLPSGYATRYLLYLYRIPEESVEKVSYRGLGWPGYMTVKLKNGGTICIPFIQYWRTGFGHYFYDKICFFCSDHTAELSDLSVGDPWTSESIINNINHRLGCSLIIARSKKGLELLTDAERKGYLKLTKLPAKYAIQTQTVQKKLAKDKTFGLKLMKIPLKIQFKYVYQSKFALLKAVNYIIGHKLATRKELWLILPVWTRLSEVLHSLIKLVK